MSDKYLYDADGKYKGKISDSKPSEHELTLPELYVTLGVVLIVAILLAIFGPVVVVSKVLDIVIGTLNWITH